MTLRVYVRSPWAARQSPSPGPEAGGNWDDVRTSARRALSCSVPLTPHPTAALVLCQGRTDSCDTKPQEMQAPGLVTGSAFGGGAAGCGCWGESGQ